MSGRWLSALKVGTVLFWAVCLIMIASHGFTKDLLGNPIVSDHAAFYSAAKLIDEGRSDLLFDFDNLSTLGQHQARMTNSPNPYILAYRNPPFYALLYLPTSRLPYVVSFWIWTLISLLMLWLGIGWLGSKDRLNAFVLALSFYPVFCTFGFGQNSLLSFGFFALCFRLLERGRPFAAGLAAGMLLYKPQLLLGLGIWWLLSFREFWKALAGVAAMGLFWVAVSVLFVPRESMLYLQNLPRIADYNLFMFYHLQNPRGFGRLIAYDDKEFGNRFGYACSAVGVAVFALFWRRHRARMPLMFAAAVFLTLWASPHTMIYEWSLALIPAVLLWENVPEKRDVWRRIFAISWIALFISGPVSRFLCEWTRPTDPGIQKQGWAIQLAVPVMAAMAVWAVRAVRPGRDRGA